MQLKLPLVWNTESVRYLNASVSPDGLRLVLTPADEYGRNRALFAIPLLALEGGIHDKTKFSTS
jgi:hypothetical protein